MRSVWRAVLCAGIIAGWSASAMAAEGVRVWVPSPVKEKPQKARAAKTKVKVVTVVVFEGRRRYSGRDWVLDGSPSGRTMVYSGPLYPF